MQSVNPRSRLLLVGVPWAEVLGTDKEVKIERLPGLDEDEKLAELISVATRKALGSLEVVTLARAWGCLFGLILRMSLR